MDHEEKISNLQSRIDVETERRLFNDRSIQKIEHRVDITEDKINKHDLVITKWVNYLYGLFTVIVTCCGIILWSGSRIIENNDNLNKSQTSEITELENKISHLENLISVYVSARKDN